MYIPIYFPLINNSQCVKNNANQSSSKEYGNKSLAV